MSKDDFKVLDRMKTNDKLIGDLLAPFEKSMGIKFNEFVKPEDPRYEEPKKKGSLKRKLHEAEKKQKKMKNLTPEQAKQEQWKNAMAKARGIKVKDDPKLIKKAIKRKGDEKKRHKKKWAERVDKLEESKRYKEKAKGKNKAKAKDAKQGRGKGKVTKNKAKPDRKKKAKTT